MHLLEEVVYNFCEANSGVAPRLGRRVGRTRVVSSPRVGRTVVFRIESLPTGAPLLKTVQRKFREMAQQKQEVLANLEDRN